MECIVLPCKSTPLRIPEITRISHKISSRNARSAEDFELKQLCKQGRLGEAIASLDSIALSSSKVRDDTLSYLIQSCIHLRSLGLCSELYTRVRKWLKQKPDPFLETKLVGMFAKCGSLDDAFNVFDEMAERNLYAWSAAIGACSREKMWGEVLDLFYSMMIEGEAFPDNFLFPKILQACGNCGDVETGRLIHAMIIKRGMSRELRVSNSILAVYAKCGWLSCAEKFFGRLEVNDIVSWNAIITGYCLHGKIDEALRFFNLMRKDGVEPGTITWNIMISSYNHAGKCDEAIEMMNEMESYGLMPDVFTWTSMISGLAQSNKGVGALHLFQKMLSSRVEPNGVTLLSAISACSSLKDLRKGKEVHLLAIRLGFAKDVLVANSLVDMYSKSGKLRAARQVFDMISEKDVYSWNTMMGGYCQAGYCGVAHELFKRMQESSIQPNVITWNVMITGYIDNGDMDQAVDLFQKMEKDGGIIRDTASWNALITGLLHNGLKNRALQIFRKMQSFGIKPNSITILSILPACANLVSVKKLKEIHGCTLRRNIDSDGSVANSLIDTYSKSGMLKYAEVIFDGKLSKDIVTWNTMIASYFAHGRYIKSIELFEIMLQQQYKPNRGTLGSVISAYGQANMVDEGSLVFSKMTEDYKVLPSLDHYTAMVNLYGRSGMLDDALNLIKRMPIEPDVSIWSAFLAACRAHGNVKLAIYAGERLLELEPGNAFIHRVVVHLYNLIGISKDFSNIKASEIRKDSTESICLSWIEDKNMVYTFTSGNLSQLGDNSLLSWIKGIELKIKASKYYDVLSIPEEEKKEINGVHSEIIALAFALIKSSQTSRSIRIIKNLRMCEQCHGFAKSVSETHGCEIYLRDPKCLHHFKNGVCSCGDYW
ncbi:pentatricopeptide repeat-containing protein At1g19720 [Primulina tabacum]|uniref:pentatricopeptide repeat-containing protein At1g19720 n=1 Tax=Primulina tabacum TaxID=48773 RepID=UPI003F5962B9